MTNYFSRTEMLLGTDSLKKLANSHVIIVGLGGVGSYVAEGLTRSGIGQLTLIDNDIVAASNINRQIQATSLNIGQAKVIAIKERLLTINPKLKVTAKQALYNAASAEQLIDKGADYVVDAIDMVSAKLHLINHCKKEGLAIISSMGTANKLDPTQLTVADIYQTSSDPLARVMRRELRKLGIAELKVVYSTEAPLKPKEMSTTDVELSKKRPTPGSVAFVPSVAGLIIAAEVVKDLLG